ncbi:MAG: hypothetical protein JXB45_12145 [Candidatus Krumholzibacteriota bacterium]|nr:hypothetical protein [Candidatus Krumholzibacteriota bacterium]
MKRGWLPVAVVLLMMNAAVAARAEPLAVEGTLFFDRGHYWIELIIKDSGEGNMSAAEWKRNDFEIVDLDNGQSFPPSRVEVAGGDEKESVLLLASGKLGGKKCYRVIIHPASSRKTVIEPICDPFYFSPAPGPSRGREFFRKFIAPAFSTSGKYYRWSRFCYQYDFDAEKSASELNLEPEFDIFGFQFKPRFNQDNTNYLRPPAERREVRRRNLEASLSKSFWGGELRYELETGYRHERSQCDEGSAAEVVYSQSALVEGRVRFDNLFDPVNRHGLGVFKGVDLGLGYAWHDSSTADIWASSAFRGGTLMLKGRFTWTFLGWMQFSYALESYRPRLEGQGFKHFHQLVFRLLLRDVLEKPSRRSYHPDLEVTFQRGRRLPLFEEETRATLGFTFDLYPW